MRYTSNGVPVARFRIAVNEHRRDPAGEKQEKTHWFSCVAWKNVAETVVKYLAKGSQVGISGSLQQRSWQRDSGETRSVVEIVVRDLTMLDGRKREGAPAAGDDQIPF
jgi:single-strand DNA-binding protein